MSRPAPSAIPFRLLPERLALLSAHCDKCGHDTQPNLFEVKPGPIVPVRPNDVAPDQPGRWIPSGMMLDCEACGAELMLPIPHEEQKARVSLYADEAVRELQGRRIFTYSVIGGSKIPLGVANESVTLLKRRLEPSREPIDWRFHMTELLSGQKRKKHPVYSTWSKAKIDDAIGELFDIVRTTENLFAYNIFVRYSGLGEKAKHDAFLCLLHMIIDDVTSRAGRPELFFDSEKPVTGERSIHGWAQRLFFDSQYCNLYAFLARGIEIPEPQFVRPASQPCLELADFVCYVIARHHYDRWRGKPSELDPARLGRVCYLGFDTTGDLGFDTTVGVPWERFERPRSRQ